MSGKVGKGRKTVVTGKQSLISICIIQVLVFRLSSGLFWHVFLRQILEQLQVNTTGLPQFLFSIFLRSVISLLIPRASLILLSLMTKKLVIKT